MKILVTNPSYVRKPGPQYHELTTFLEKCMAGRDRDGIAERAIEMADTGAGVVANLLETLTKKNILTKDELAEIAGIYGEFTLHDE